MSRRKRKKKLELPIRQRLQIWYQAKGPVLRFSLKLGLLMALLYLLLALPVGDQSLYAYLRANAWASSIILNEFGQHTVLAGLTVASAKFSVTIERGCDAVEPTWLFCAAVFSFPSSWQHKIMGIVAGIVLLQILNLARIVTLFFIGAYAPSIFNASHMEIWPAIFIVLAVAFFVIWKDWTIYRTAHVAV